MAFGDFFGGQPPGSFGENGALQGNFFGDPDPIHDKPKHPPGIEAFLGGELKTRFQERCATMGEPMSKMSRTLIDYFTDETEEARQFRLKMLLKARDQRRKPRGNPAKGGTASGVKRKKADNPTPE